MKYYYFNINTDDKGRHEIHTEHCSHKPSSQNSEYIGYFSNCKEALEKARKKHPSKSFDGCYYCCERCHKG